jgi:hypothetical protein
VERSFAAPALFSVAVAEPPDAVVVATDAAALHLEYENAERGDDDEVQLAGGLVLVPTEPEAVQSPEAWG